MNTPKPNISKLFALLAFLFSVQISFAQKPYCLYDSEKGEVTLGYGINLPEGAEEINVTSGHMFDGTSIPSRGCYGLYKITIESSFADFSPNTCSYWFAHLKDLKEIVNIQYINTSAVTDMNGMFYDCDDIVSLDLSSFVTNNVTDMQNMFLECNHLKSVDLSSFNTSNVTDMSGMFLGCSNLKTLDLSTFTTNKVQKIGSMFAECYRLKTIYVSANWNLSSLASWANKSDVFRACYSLYGGNGTYCVGEGVEYAIIDKGESQPGYFTQKGTDPFDSPATYALYNETTQNLTLGYGTPLPSGAKEVFPYGGYIGADVVDADQVKKVEIGESFKNFKAVTCAEWFKGCSNLLEIEGLANIITDEVWDMSNMFRQCKSLKSIDLSGFNTANVTKMVSMFEDCERLINLDLSSFSNAKVSNMGGMFSNCRRLKYIYVSDKWVENTESSYEVFKNCHKLYGGQGSHCGETDVKYARVDGGTDKPGYFTPSGTDPYLVDVPYALFNSETKTLTLGCAKILPQGAVEIEEEAINNETWIGYGVATADEVVKVIIGESFSKYQPTKCSFWFNDCVNLIEIDGLTNINAVDVTSMKGMFFCCKLLTSIDLSSFDMAKVTDISLLFYNCQSLITIFVNANLNLDSDIVTASNSMFSGCEKLYGGMGTYYIESAFKYAKIDGGKDSPGYFTKSGAEPYIPSWPYAIFDSQTGVLTLGAAKSIPNGAIDLNIKPTTTGFIANKFIESADVKKVVIEESFAEFKPKTCCRWFFQCTNLTEIDGLNNINSSELTDMSYMFYGCRALESVDFSKFDTKNVTNMASLFEQCEKLETIDLSGFDTKNVTNMSSMFWGCSVLKTVFVSETWNTEAVDSWSSIFANCYKICGGEGTSWTASDIEYAHIDGGADNPGYFTKSGAEPYTPTLVYGVFNTETGTLTLGYSKKIPSNAIVISNNNFKNSVTQPENIKKIIIDQSFYNYVPTSCFGWFSGLNNLTEIEGLSNINTAMVTDMGSMFSGCNSLKTIDLSGFNTENLTSMGSMFSNCESLQTVYVSDKWNTDAVTWSSLMFTGCYNLFGSQGTNCNASFYGDCLPFARIDGGESAPGYFTKVGTTPYIPITYAIFNSETQTLTLGLSNVLPDGAKKINTANGSDWIANEIVSADKVKKVVIDKSFAKLSPETCSGWFCNCTNLTEIDGLENINTVRVADMSAMFKNCQSLESLDLGNFNTKTVTNMAEMFNSCINLKTIFVSDNWNIEYVTDADKMFDLCDNLYGGKGTHFTESDISYARIDLGSNYPGYFTKSGDEPYTPFSAYILFDTQTGTLTVSYGNSFPEGSALIDPNDISVGCYIGSELTEAKNVKKIVIDKSFAEFKPYRCQRWFNFCSNVTEIEGIANIKTEDVEDMGEMFCLCSSLVTLDLSSFDTKKVKNMNAMFNGCTSLKTIYVSDKWSVESVTDCADMFSPDKKLYGGKGTPYTVSDIKYARIDGGADNPGYFTQSGTQPFEPSLTYGIFNSQTGTLTLGYSKTLPDGATEINAEKTTSEQWIASEITDAANVKTIVVDKSFADFHPTLCSYWFYRCSNLAEIEGIENISTANVTDMRRMFYLNQALPALDLRTFNTAKVKDMYEMFFSCDELKTVVVSDKWTTENVEVSSAMFRFCDNLVGGKGTKFDEDKALDKTFAKLDGGADNPGYFSENFPVVIEVLPIAIEIKVSPKTEYTEGDALSTENGVLTIKYSDNTTQTVDLSEAEITGFDSDKVGEQTLTVKYVGFTTELVVNVKAKSNGNPEDNPGTPVSGNPTADNIRIWSFGHTVFVENAQKEIQVVNTLGKTILRQSPTTDRIELNIQKSGIYIIKTGNEVQKVIIR